MKTVGFQGKLGRQWKFIPLCLPDSLPHCISGEISKGVTFRGSDKGNPGDRVRIAGAIWIRDIYHCINKAT